MCNCKHAPAVNTMATLYAMKATSNHWVDGVYLLVTQPYDASRLKGSPLSGESKHLQHRHQGTLASRRTAHPSMSGKITQ